MLQGYTLTHTTYLEVTQIPIEKTVHGRNKGTPLDPKYVHCSHKHEAVVKYCLLR